MAESPIITPADDSFTLLISQSGSGSMSSQVSLKSKNSSNPSNASNHQVESSCGSGGGGGGGTGGGISDPEEYSSTVATAVANIIASAKAEDLKETEEIYRLEDGTTEPPSVESVILFNSHSQSGGGGKKSLAKISKAKKAKSKLSRTKSKTKTTGSGGVGGSGTGVGGNALKRSATAKPITSTLSKESFGALSIALHNAASHTGATKLIPAPALLPRTPNVMDLNLYLNRIQMYFNQLGYHRQGEPKIRVTTSMSIRHQIETARSLIKAGEPIKCLHALVMAIHFTNCTNHIERFPINFKSEFNGKEYKHVVLGVYLYGMFGALGISRDPGLQDKPAAYPRLIDLIADYHKCYTESGHYVMEVKIGGIITHDPHSLELINWKLGTVPMDLHPSSIELAFEKIGKQLRSKMGSACLRNIRPMQSLPPELTLTHQLTKGESTTPPAVRQTPAVETIKKTKTMSVTHVPPTTNKVRSKKAQVKPAVRA